MSSNVQNTADWVGTYFGMLPCGSCPGINTVITLNEDETFEKTTEYLESKDIPETIKGKLQWSKDKSIITIGENTYLVGKKTIVFLRC